MVDFSKIPGSLKFGVRVERSLRRNFARAVAFFGGEGAEEVSREELACRRMVLSLVRTVMESGRPMRSGGCWRMSFPRSRSNG